jgi:hypothetical protein
MDRAHGLVRVAAWRENECSCKRERCKILFDGEIHILGQGCADQKIFTSFECIAVVELALTLTLLREEMARLKRVCGIDGSNFCAAIVIIVAAAEEVVVVSTAVAIESKKSPFPAVEVGMVCRGIVCGDGMVVDGMPVHNSDG